MPKISIDIDSLRLSIKKTLSRFAGSQPNLASEAAQDRIADSIIAGVQNIIIRGRTSTREGTDLPDTRIEDVRGATGQTIKPDGYGTDQLHCHSRPGPPTVGEVPDPPDWSLRGDNA